MIDEILQSRMQGDSAKTIAARLALPIGTISSVFCGLAFTERLGVDGNPTFAELRSVRSILPQVKLTEDDVVEIRDLLAQGFSGRSIAVRYGVSPPTISHIKTGKR
jgi:DNA-binding NarL/FixJ family response regulator